jgi:hypothetical protein
MKKMLFVLISVSSCVKINAQLLQSSEKGREFIQLMEVQLETYYGHDMKITPTYEKGMREYAFEQAGQAFNETPFDGKAHYHTLMKLEPENFEVIDNARLVKILAPDEGMNAQIKEMLETINPNRFFVESYLIKDKLYIVLGLDRPFDYTTWKAEE